MIQRNCSGIKKPVEQSEPANILIKLNKNNTEKYMENILQWKKKWHIIDEINQVCFVLLIFFLKSGCSLILMWVTKYLKFISPLILFTKVAKVIRNPAAG